VNEHNIQLGNLDNGQVVAVRQNNLTTHAAVLGMTGSGKTGLLIGMIEEFVKNGVPTVIVDIKGDMANIALQPNEDLRKKMDVRILTPGSDHGESINVIAELENKGKISQAVSALLSLVGEKTDPLKSKPHAYISAILEFKHGQNQECDLESIIEAVQDPPFANLGAMPVDDVLSSGRRKALAAKLNNVLVAPSFKYWREGIEMELKDLLEVSEAGKTPVLIYSVAHLVSDDERLFALSLLFEEMVLWMRSNKGAQGLEHALIVDECYGLLPPTKKPSTKVPLLTMLKQGRGFGLGVILASQNPMDLDYKAMANCQTWLIGKLQTDNDRKRVIAGVVVGGSKYDKKSLTRTVGGLQPRQFLLAYNGKTAVFNTRNVSAQLTGPMTEDDILDLYTRGLVSKPSAVVTFVDRMADVLHIGKR
jgi:DNA helicase HerA-like ATPase